MHQTAREMFEAARDAAREAARCRRLIDAERARRESLGGGGLGPRVRSTPDHDRMAARIASATDREAMLRARLAECEAQVDAAGRVLYGADGRGGLRSLVGWPADAIHLHYLALMTWGEAGDVLGYSEAHAKRMAYAAMDYADSNGQMWTELGRGFATR